VNGNPMKNGLYFIFYCTDSNIIRIRRNNNKLNSKNNEKNIPTSQSQESEQARIPRAHEHKERPQGSFKPSQEGSQEAERFKRASRKIMSFIQTLIMRAQQLLRPH
jgi:hypothetical protein